MWQRKCKSEYVSRYNFFHIESFSKDLQECLKLHQLWIFLFPKCFHKTFGWVCTIKQKILRFDNHLFTSKLLRKTIMHKSKLFTENIGLFIKPGIQERGMEYGECRERGECSLGFRGMLFFEHSGECSRRFRGMFKKIPRNVQKESGECLRRFREMFEKVPGNVQNDSRECSRRLYAL